MKRNLYSMLIALVLSVLTLSVSAQGTIKGVVLDPETNETLAGANVALDKTTNGTITDMQGKFLLSTSAGMHSLSISFVGFETYEMQVNVKEGQTIDLGKITLKTSSVTFDDIVVVGKGVIDLEEDRKTPIAVSTITVNEIQSKAVGNVEFPEAIKNTPSVYVSNQSGGFGDSQMFLRGFDQRNTAFLLNGQPINGMEDGRMYWSNWAGISDIANAIQVQRGLGSSKLAISSVGGTVNIVTKATDLKKGGFARLMYGNDNYLKGTLSYNTGLSENGWGISALLDYWQADNKWAEGTKGQGQNYFFSVGKKAGNHMFNFLLVGAPQWHGQNFTKSKEDYDQYGIKYNSNWGELDGEFLTIRKNYYHKPIINLNWDWNINEKSNLSTVLYASFGRGGGTGTLGNGPGYIDNGIDSISGLVNWDYIVDNYNPTIEGGISSGYNGTVIRSSVNNHAWYGLVTNYEFLVSDNLTFNIGADARFYQGDHFRQLVDLLGLSGREATLMNNTHVVNATFDANPWASLFNYASQSERVAYDYSETLIYEGLFGQAEYATDAFSVFAQASISNQSYTRGDRTNFDDVQKSATINRTGLNIKGGASYALADNHILFANAGLYSRQPFLDNIFPSYSDYTAEADPKVDNEQIVGLEVGYRFSATFFAVNLNAYYTTWENRFLDISGTDDNGVEFRTLYTDVAQNHKGVELDINYKPMLGWMLRGYASIGDWKYYGSTPFKTINSDNNQVISEGDVDFSGTKIGQAPQTSIGIGTSYDILKNKLTLDLDFNQYANFYGYVSESDAVESEGNYQPEKLNNYALLDAGLSYKILVGTNYLTFRANVYNVFNTEYVSQQDSYGILYGAGTTWNFSVKYAF